MQAAAGEHPLVMPAVVGGGPSVERQFREAALNERGTPFDGLLGDRVPVVRPEQLRDDDVVLVLDAEFRAGERLVGDAPDRTPALADQAEQDGEAALRRCVRPAQRDVVPGVRFALHA